MIAVLRDLPRLKLAQGLNKCSPSAKILEVFHFPIHGKAFLPQEWKAHLPRCMARITSKPYCCIAVLRAQPVHTWPACDKNGSDFFILTFDYNE